MLNVELLSHTPDCEKIVASAAKLCYSSSEIKGIMNGLDEEKNKSFLDKLMSMGHESPIEHVSFTFGIEGVSRACYDNQTQILTKRGWKLFRDIQEKEEVLTLNSNGQAEFQKIINKIQYNFKGQMHHYRAQNLDLCVTPNHNLFIKKYDVRTNANYKLIPSEEITWNRMYMNSTLNYNPNISDDITIDGYNYIKKDNQGKTLLKNSGDLILNRKSFYKLLAWFLAEGSVYYNSKENTYSINIAQYKKQNIPIITQIVEENGFVPIVDKTGVHFKNLTIGKFFMDLGKGLSKKIPYNLFENFNQELAKVFLKEYIRGDGTVDKSGCSKIFTISPILADQLYTLVFISGDTATYHIDNRIGDSHILNGQTVTHRYACYVINVSSSGKRNREIVVKRKQHLTFKKYNNMVYCVEVPNHVIFVRRNGRAVWCGNCTHQLVRHRIASYSQQSQRYVKAGQFEYIIPPELKKNSDAMDIFIEAMEQDQRTYDKLVDILKKQHYSDLLKQGKTDKQANNMAEKMAIEDARFVLPNATATKIICTMNARSLLNFFHHRCCERAQWEIREMATQMLMLVKEVAPTLFKYAGPSCLSGKCPEGKMSCGKMIEKKKKFLGEE